MTETSTRRFVRRDFVEPRIGMSACLELEACRYNGQRIPDSFVRRLLDYVEVDSVCPEVEIGLDVPREPVRLVASDDTAQLVQPSTGRVLTDAMDAFAGEFLDGVAPLDGWILKSGSPSCGPTDVKVYAAAEKAPVVRKEAGRFARHVLDRHGELAVESEGRLRNYPIRHHFLTRLFAYADLRRLGDEPRTSAIVDFQRRHKHLLMTYDQQGMRELGRIAAHPEDAPPEQIYERYAKRFRSALLEQPGLSDYINAFTHMYGHFKRELSEAERDEFFGALDDYRNRQLPLHAVLAILRSWASRFEYDYFADQSLLEPYPRELVQMRDSGKGVDF